MTHVVVFVARAKESSCSGFKVLAKGPKFMYTTSPMLQRGEGRKKEKDKYSSKVNSYATAARLVKIETSKGPETAVSIGQPENCIGKVSLKEEEHSIGLARRNQPQ